MTKKSIIIVLLILFVKVKTQEIVYLNNNKAEQIPLFARFPKLKQQIEYISFCTLPTPVVKLSGFNKIINRFRFKYKNIYMKCDYLTGTKIDNENYLYGGNKPRKLCFLLADALKKNARNIITYGCAGSNHALATAVYANQLGLKSTLMLKHQPNSSVVKQNLLLDLYYKANVKFFPNNQSRNIAKDAILKEDDKSYFIPSGGSNALGVLGFVNAAFELNDQIKSGILPEPDFIYVAAGSCGTISGLLLGIRMLNLKSKIVAVTVEPEENQDEIRNLAKQQFLQANQLLNSIDSSIQIYNFPHESLIIRNKFCGNQYGLCSNEDRYAIELFKKTENINIEATYTTKPIRAIIEDKKKHLIKKNDIVLFWNTYCGLDYSKLTKSIDYKVLPKEFHQYFENEIV